MFIDFADLKQRVSIRDVVKMLGLTLKEQGNQWRGFCPACKSGGDRALVITDGKGYFCFADKKGGDQIALAAHILGLSVKEAAQEIASRAGLTGTSNVPARTSQTVPESGGGQQGDRTMQPLAYLEAEHDAVVAVGFDTEFCKEHGIGYAPKGMMRGMVAIPFRDERGNLLGYIGVTDAKLPADFTTNVVSLEKRRA